MEEQSHEHHEHHAAHHIDHVHAKKRISWKKVGIVLGAIAAVIALYFIITSLTGGTAVADASNLKLEYTLKTEDGTVIAENTSSFKPGKVGEYFGFASSKLDDAILKLKEGGKVSITLDAEDAFGEYNESYVSIVNKTEVIKRELEINRTMDISQDLFNQSFNADAEVGKTYSIDGAPWNYSVAAIEGDNITISIDAKVGQFIPSQNEIFYATISKLTADKVTLLYSADEQITDKLGFNASITSDDENIYLERLAKKGDLMPMGYFMGRVTDVGDKTVTVDLNGDYAGKKIIVEVKVVEVTKKKAAATTKSTITTKKVEGAPTLETFVMSYCPYGTQMEKGVIPAMKLLAGKANFEIRFVSYTMHGEKEDTENSRQICLREEQPDKFWTYLECFLDAGDAAGCVESTGLDSDKLSTCMTDNAATYLEADKELNTKYSVQGSPTNILDGENIQISRSPEDVKKAVCAAFDTAPSECDETLDTASPSPGFGFKAATASSSSGGGCGA